MTATRLIRSVKCSTTGCYWRREFTPHLPYNEYVMNVLMEAHDGAAAHADPFLIFDLVDEEARA